MEEARPLIVLVELGDDLSHRMRGDGTLGVQEDPALCANMGETLA